MNFKIKTTVVALLISVGCFAQITDDDVLFTVDKTPVLASEFIRVYNKNLDLVKDESQKDVDEYLKLFVNYKLKLAEARALNFDKKPSYIREFSGYKKQLTKNHLTDHKVTDALVKEAYDRISYDVNAKHLLIKLEPSQKDTLATYNRLLKLRERLRNEDFDKLQKELHNGNTMLLEDLGYFSGFKMVYAFENAAYNTNVGEVSMPFRTQFGYHIVKVFDKRKSRGEITVGHIMLANDQKDSLVKPELRIQEIYKLLQQDENFESLAKQFSDDKSSSKKGGKLSAFKSGQLSSVTFEDMAFSLTDIGEVSKPFKTDYGWHITKLYNKTPLASFEEMKYSLENKVQRDPRSKLINTAMHKSLRQKYGIKNTNNELPYFVSILDSSYFDRKWNTPENFPKDKTLLTIGKKTIHYHDFANFLKSVQKRVRNKISFQSLVEEQYKAFIDAQVMTYHEANLEFENEDFAQILSEYREGLLLFDLMETKIWNAVKNDTSGLKDHYENNKANYKWQERIDAIIATCAKKEDAAKVKKMLADAVDIETIKVQLNNNDQPNVIFTSRVMNAEHQALPESFKFKEGISKIQFYNDAYHVIKVNEVLPETTKTFEESKGIIISEYQNVVEQQWLQDLSNKFYVTINNDVLAKVKSQINN